MRRHSDGEAVDDLSGLLNALQILRDAQTKEEGRSPLPFYSDCFLLYIAAHPGGLPLHELQDRFRLVHSSASRTCKALESVGLVHVSQLPEDRRQSFVKLTARGQRVIDEVLAAFRGKRR